MDPSASLAISDAIAACQDAVASLREEKAALMAAVLALKTQERQHWERSLARERERLLRTQHGLKASCRVHAAPVAADSYQHDIEARERAIAEYDELLQRALVGEEELRVMLDTCRGRLARAAGERGTPPHKRAIHAVAHQLETLSIQAEQASHQPK